MAKSCEWMITFRYSPHHSCTSNSNFYYKWSLSFTLPFFLCMRLSVQLKQIAQTCQQMKRQITNVISGTSTILVQPNDMSESYLGAEMGTKKKARNQGDKWNSEEDMNRKLEDGQSIPCGQEGCGTVVMSDTIGSFEECWPPWLSGVDEQMSWGSIWLPFWDLDNLGKDYDALYSDVVWDEDIWNLKAIKKVPKPSEKVEKN